MGPSMSRRFEGGKIVIASHNQGKVKEIADLLAPYGADLVPASELGLPEPEETGQTFAENSEIKALGAAREAGLAALADDSGLVVAALDGAPGIHSARWAGPNKDFAAAMNRIEEALSESAAAGRPGRQAHFTCALTLAWPDGHVETFEGHVHGRLVWPPRGGKGFGYDPIFVAHGHDITFAEMGLEAKHAISHRAEALKRLVAACFEG
ncbi:MAG: RdgB/HAM1 family non-canonical purine NTP pyrophosphatase [Rhodospirillales bacterium]